MARTRSAARRELPSSALLSRLLSLPDELLEAVVRSLLDANNVCSLLRLGQACKDLVPRLALVRAEAEAQRRLCWLAAISRRAAIRDDGDAMDVALGARALGSAALRGAGR